MDMVLVVMKMMVKMLEHNQVMDDNDAEEYYFLDKQILNDENLNKINL
jgi:hypothetical protein